MYGKKIMLASSNGNFKIMATHEKGALTVPQMFEQGILSKIPKFAQLAQWPGKASYYNLASRTMGAFSFEKPLCEQPTENGKIYIEKETMFTHTRFGGFTVDALREAGINVEKKNIFLAMDEGYIIADVSMKWPKFQYSILAQDMPPQQLARVLHAFENSSYPSHVSLKSGELNICTASQSKDVDDGGVLKEGIFYFDYSAPGPITIRAHTNYFSSGWAAEIGVYQGLLRYGYSLEDKKR
ncbi:MAG: hypothetical protein NT051_04570 [Candidatus Micrarchaeota archaeon]|nr:hypothetical protein [Candidatus Micrarchaeota archaeon]